MDHADAFLQDIIAHPGDDAPRLIYADWLLDQGDADSRARAEFIRVQYALEDLRPGDPRRAALEQRQRDILIAHEAEWTAGLRELGVQGWTFRRGFAEGVQIHPHWLETSGEQLRTRIPLRELQLTGWLNEPYSSWQEIDWGLFVELPLVEQITTLDLSDFVQRQGIPDLFENGRLVNLTKAILPRSVASWLADSARLPALRSLRVAGSGVPITHLFNSTCFAGLSHLELLEGISDPEAKSMARTNSLANLEELAIGEIQSRSTERQLARKVFPRLRQLTLVRSFRSPAPTGLLHGDLVTTIESLELSRNGLGDSTVSALVGASLPQLRHLGLSVNQITRNAAESIAKGFPTLESLNLRTNRLGDEGLLALLTGDYPLRELNVSYNGIGQSGLAAMGQSRPSHLQVLDLSWNPCRDEGIVALMASDAVRGLKMLDLSYCELTDRAIKVLASSPAVSNLEVLNLSTNRIGDAGMTALAESKYLGALRSLHLGNTAISDKGAKELLDSPLLSRLEVLMLNQTAIRLKMRERLRKEFRGILG